MCINPSTRQPSRFSSHTHRRASQRLIRIKKGKEPAGLLLHHLNSVCFRKSIINKEKRTHAHTVSVIPCCCSRPLCPRTVKDKEERIIQREKIKQHREGFSHQRDEMKMFNVTNTGACSHRKNHQRQHREVTLPHQRWWLSWNRAWFSPLIPQQSGTKLFLFYPLIATLNIMEHLALETSSINVKKTTNHRWAVTIETTPFIETSDFCLANQNPELKSAVV